MSCCLATCPVARRVGESRLLSGAVFYRRSVSELLEQRKQLILIDRGDENSGRDRAQSNGARGRVGKERRSLRLVRQANIAAGWADPDAAVPPRHIVNEVSERLGDSGGGMPLQPPSYIRCRPALVEGAAQRGSGEPIDARTAPRLLIATSATRRRQCVQAAQGLPPSDRFG